MRLTGTIPLQCFRYQVYLILVWVYHTRIPVANSSALIYPGARYPYVRKCALMKPGFQWGTFQKEEQEITAKLLLLSHGGLGASIVDP